MFCKNCGTEITEGNVCPNCGKPVAPANPAPAAPVNPAPAAADPAPAEKPARKAAKPKFDIFLIACGIVVLVMFLMAASLVSDGGNGIMQIESVGGKTLEEAYYFELGSVYAGFAMALRAMGIFCAALLIHKGVCRDR